MRAIATVLSLVLLPLLVVTDCIAQRILRVPSQFKSIQAAINAAYPLGDVVLVEPGTYKENLDFFRKAITVCSERGPGQTVIDGGQKGSVVIFNSGEGHDSVLEGFTLTNGTGTRINGKLCGGGICCLNSSPTIRDNIMSSNTADNGGGIYCERTASHSILRNEISGNIGGGIYCTLSSPTIQMNRILGNKAYSGAGILCTSSTVNITGNEILGNTTTGYFGGGIRSMNGSDVVTNNVIAYNVALDGGGVSMDQGFIVNNTIWGNFSSNCCGGIKGTSATTILNCIVWNNDSKGAYPQIGPQSAKATYCCVEGGFLGKGNLSVDPKLVDPATGDFHLNFDSPCRDQGLSSVVGLPKEDYEGDSRISFKAVDIGADEFYPHLYLTGNPRPGGRISINVIGDPGPVVTLGLSTNPEVFDPPILIPGIAGKLYIKPLFFLIPLGAIPQSGLTKITLTVPKTLPTNTTFPFQALIGLELSNLMLVTIQ